MNLEEKILHTLKLFKRYQDAGITGTPEEQARLKQEIEKLKQEIKAEHEAGEAPPQ